MDKHIESMRKRIEAKIEQAHKELEMLDQIPAEPVAQAFPKGSWGYTYADNFEFELALDYATVDKARVFMATQYPDWKLVKDKLYVVDGLKYASHILTYKKDETEFDFMFRSSVEGSTCVVRQIGTAIQPERTVPIYEVVCPEGAEESSELP